MASSSFSAPSPPIFNGENYSIWNIKMQTYLKAYGLWEATTTTNELAPLRENASLNQIRLHDEEASKGFKALTAIHSSVSDTIFTRIITCKTAKEAWDKLQKVLDDI